MPPDTAFSYLPRTVLSIRLDGTPSHFTRSITTSRRVSATQRDTAEHCNSNDSSGQKRRYQAGIGHAVDEFAAPEARSEGAQRGQQSFLACGQHLLWGDERRPK